MKSDCQPKPSPTTARSLNKAKLLLAFAGCVMVANASAATINVVKGWNLLGNSEASAVDVATRLNDVAAVVTVWKWNKALSKWAFYTPSMTSAELATYAQSKGYEVLARIGSKEGYWVNAAKATALADPQASSSNAGSPAAVLLESDLVLGWNLSASADNKTPAQLNAGLSTSLSSAGKGIVTQWAWDASAARWKFFAPTLAAQGGTVLSDYINSKTYAAFDTVIGLQEGFWLNISAVAGGTTQPPSIRLTDTGITAAQCYQAGSNVLVSCTSAAAIALNDKQDGMLGRDVTTPDAADGKLGFSYSTVPNPAGGSYALTECVKDNITGLMWEGKPITGTRIASATYTNYGDNRSGDASAYVAEVNAAGLCGYNNWRLPTADELQTIVDYSVPAPSTPINDTWFPNTMQTYYWSSTGYAGLPLNSVWVVNFAYGWVATNNTANAGFIRLVR